MATKYNMNTWSYDKPIYILEVEFVDGEIKYKSYLTAKGVETGIKSIERNMVESSSHAHGDNRPKSYRVMEMIHGEYAPGTPWRSLEDLYA